MADEKTPETTAAEQAAQTPAAAPAPAAPPAPEVEERAPFQHQISRSQYIAGLEAELQTATTKAHKAAVKAELDAIVAEHAVQEPKETA